MGTVDKAEAILNSALTHVNGPPLGYDPQYHDQLRMQILDFIEQYPKTIPLKIGSYTANDGTEHRLLMLDGVVPMHYKNQKFNLPIAIWIPKKFPIAAPVAYVKRNPKQFTFNAKCKIIDATQDGRITSDYIRQWAYPHSNLYDFVGDLRIYFADQPPLFQKPPEQQQQQQQQAQTHAHASTEMYNPLSPAVSAAAGAAAAAAASRPQQPPPTQLPPLGWGVLPIPTPSASQQQHYQQQTPQSYLSQGQMASSSGNIPMPIAGAPLWQGAISQQEQQAQQQAQKLRQEQLSQQRKTAYHLALTTGLAARLAGALEAAASSEKQEQLNIQAELQQRNAAVTQEVQKMQKEREALDSAAHELASAGAALDKWLSENEPKAQSLRAAVDGNIDPDEAIVPSNPLSGQALAAQAADLALEDTLSALDRALESRKVTLEDYLMQVRSVSRRQFTARALAGKIANKQMSERAALGSGAGGAGAVPPPPPPLASAVSTEHAQLPIGDVWHTTGGILLNPLAAAAAANTNRR